MNYSEETLDNSVTAVEAPAAEEVRESAENPASESAAEPALETDGIAASANDAGKNADERGEISVAQVDNNPVETPDYITRSEAEQLIERAYLRGRNQAVRAQMIDDSMLNGEDNRRYGIADDIAEIFRTRPSVWDNSL